MTEIVNNPVIALLVVPVLLNMFKSEIADSFAAMSMIWGSCYHKGQVIETLGLDGQWRLTMIHDYRFSVPGRPGGVTLLYRVMHGDTPRYYVEVVRFGIWRKLRTRTAVCPASGLDKIAEHKLGGSDAC